MMFRVNRAANTRWHWTVNPTIHTMGDAHVKWLVFQALLFEGDTAIASYVEGEPRLLYRARKIGDALKWVPTERWLGRHSEEHTALVVTADALAVMDPPNFIRISFRPPVVPS